MIFTDEHMTRRVQYTDRSGNVSYGTIRGITSNFVDISREGYVSQRTFFVPMDTLVLVDGDGVPQVE
jgi:hypothetical protein